MTSSSRALIHAGIAASVDSSLVSAASPATALLRKQLGAAEPTRRELGGLETNSVRPPSRATSNGRDSVQQEPPSQGDSKGSSRSPTRLSSQKTSGAGFTAALRQLRGEIIEKCAVQAAAVSEEVDFLRRELVHQQAVQGKICMEQRAALRREAEIVAQAERDRRSLLEVRSTVERMQAGIHARAEQDQWSVIALQSRVERMQAEMQTGMQVAGAGDRGGGSSASVPSGLLEELATELRAERELRCAHDAELHGRMGREVCDLARRLEEHAIAFREEMADQAQRDGETQTEFRAILDSVWRRASGRRMTNGSASASPMTGRASLAEDGDCRHSDYGGEHESMDTLYGMVREALGDTAQCNQRLTEECGRRERHEQHFESLVRQVSTLQALVREATDQSRPRGSPKHLPDGTPSSACEDAASTKAGGSAAGTSASASFAPP